MSRGPSSLHLYYLNVQYIVNSDVALDHAGDHGRLDEVHIYPGVCDDNVALARRGPFDDRAH